MFYPLEMIQERKFRQKMMMSRGGPDIIQMNKQNLKYFSPETKQEILKQKFQLQNEKIHQIQEKQKMKIEVIP